MNHDNSTSTKPTGKAAGGFTRAQRMTPEQRSESARKAANAKASLGKLPQASHEGVIKIGDIEIPCAVLPNGQRLLTQSGFMQALGRARQAKGREYYDGDVNMPAFLTAKNLKPFISNDLHVTSSQIEFRLKSGIRAFGYSADILPKVCDVYLSASDADALTHAQKHVAKQAMVLMRGLAHVGIIALVDEATGYQRDRAKDALAKVLESFVAKELQPYVKTFPAEFYEEMFRLRGLQYPSENPKFRPQYFGLLTNDIVYERLAPGLLEEIKRQSRKDEKKAHLHRRLTQEVGHPKLREHLASVVTAMRLSNDYADFIAKLNRLHPRFGKTFELALEDGDR